MPVYVIVILNLVLCSAVIAAIVGLLSWCIATQHRDSGCDNVRLRRPRLRISVNLVAASGEGRVEPATEA